MVGLSVHSMDKYQRMLENRQWRSNHPDLSLRTFQDRLADAAKDTALARARTGLVSDKRPDKGPSKPLTAV